MQHRHCAAVLATFCALLFTVEWFVSSNEDQPKTLAALHSSLLQDRFVDTKAAEISSLHVQPIPAQGNRKIRLATQPDKAEQGGMGPSCRLGECPDTNGHMDITLVTVVTLNRLSGLERICKVWQGQVVAVISIGNIDPMNIIGYAGETAQKHITVFCARAIFFSVEEKRPQFPINKLRNLGVAVVSTTHMLYLDADFLPSTDLYGRLLLQLSQPMLQRSNVATVVPAFEFIAHKLPEVPQHFSDLISCMKEHRCKPLDFAGFLGGNSTAKYDEWVAQSGRPNRKIRCFEADLYEPYVLIRACGCMPKLFDEVFKGCTCFAYLCFAMIHAVTCAGPCPMSCSSVRFHKTRLQMIEYLRISGYAFYVLPKAFAIHLPHEGLTLCAQDALRDTPRPLQ